MPTILHLEHKLIEPPQIVSVPSVTIRHLGSKDDPSRWLGLRANAFAAEQRPVGPWTEAHFQREFLSKPWWQPDRMLLAESKPSGELIGSVTLGEHGRAENSRPALHWLLVDPAWRRRGVARALVSRLERRCWELGRYEIVVETHSAWRSAAQFYRALGYLAPPRRAST